MDHSVGKYFITHKFDLSDRVVVVVYTGNRAQRSNRETYCSGDVVHTLSNRNRYTFIFRTIN